MAALDNLTADIPYLTARRAHEGTSFVPEKRAASEQAEYAATLRQDYDELSKFATTDDKRATLDSEFARYRAGYRQRNLAWLHSRSRMMSTMIAGPSNFPVRRQEKLGNWAHNHLTELLSFRERALAAIKRKLRPEHRPIMSGDSDAVERLQEKIAKAEKWQALIKAVNAAIRKHKKAGADAQLAAIVALGLKESAARKLLEPDYMGRIGFADYELTNNNANIRRMKQRLASISHAKTLEDEQVEGENATVEDCPSENRVRLFFPGKPDETIRAKLKSNGFRWTPTLGCWQAYRSEYCIQLAKEIAG